MRRVNLPSDACVCPVRKALQVHCSEHLGQGRVSRSWGQGHINVLRFVGEWSLTVSS